MNKPTPLSGFPEFLPSQRTVEREVIATLSRTFELHGFGNIETRAVEPMDQLLRKGDTSKEVYVLKRLQEQDESRDKGMGLHFDLTVPFARYVLENAGKLEFPFRRYQIQKVWRGERPQEGRFREFAQADIDIVGRDTLPFHHDVEVARVMLEALGKLTFLPGFTLQVNNRKLIQGFYAGLGVPDVEETMRLIDKLDKMPATEVGKLLVAEAGLSDEQAAKCLELATITATDDTFVEKVRAMGVESDLLDEGLTELATLINATAPLNTERVRIVADLSIARGLDYYTGTVFETRLDGYESLGSICSGGRYDALASDGKTTYPGVGISLGVSRVLVPLVQKGVLDADRKVPSTVLVAVSDEESRAEADAAAQQLRAHDVACEVSPNAAKFGKQIRFAERRGIPYVLFATRREDGTEAYEIKDIRTGDQVPADPATWTPANQNDLTPQVVSTGSTTGNDNEEQEK
ncbi:histidine--tRNA ligase [Nocardioides sp. NPDC006273]|uniref:histidine--tRNA ligase n=1 Tax=Nocardioides sp. NPDC006273 TaxID=3155598 RepID=UPI0033BE712A